MREPRRRRLLRGLPQFRVGEVQEVREEVALARKEETLQHPQLLEAPLPFKQDGLELRRARRVRPVDRAREAPGRVLDDVRRCEGGPGRLQLIVFTGTRGVAQDHAVFPRREHLGEVAFHGAARRFSNVGREALVPVARVVVPRDGRLLGVDVLGDAELAVRVVELAVDAPAPEGLEVGRRRGLGQGREHALRVRVAGVPGRVREGVDHRAAGRRRVDGGARRDERVQGHRRISTRRGQSREPALAAPDHGLELRHEDQVLAQHLAELRRRRVGAPPPLVARRAAAKGPAL